MRLEYCFPQALEKAKWVNFALATVGSSGMDLTFW